MSDCQKVGIKRAKSQKMTAAIDASSDANINASLNTTTVAIGRAFEDCALAFLRHQDFELVTQNYTVRGVGELDLLLHKTINGRQTLICVEVKARQNKVRAAQWGGVLAQITPKKRARIVAAMRHFLAENTQFAAFDVRFDVITFEGGELAWLENAFLGQ